MTMNGAVLPILAFYHRGGRGAGRDAGAARRAPSRTTSSRSSWSATPTSTRPSPRCGSSRTSSATPAAEHAEVQLDLDLRLPHAGSRRDAGLRSSPSRIADGMEYVRSTASPAASISTSSRRRLSFFWAIGMNFFMEVGQAARRARAVAPRDDASFGAKDERSQMLRTHCQTSGVSLHGAGPLSTT